MHGITVNEPLAGTRPIAAVATAVIGIVGTAPAAPNDDYPLDKPILITDVRAALATIGATGTLPKALEAIALQCSPIIILVRVAPGADDAATETAIAGDVGTYTGVHALVAAESQLGVRPRILGVPGLDTQAVITELVTVAKKLRGFVYASCDAANTVAEAVIYRGEFGDRELMLIYPDFSGFPGHAVAVALGTRARIDQETGWHKTLSNVAVAGVTGLSAPIGFDLQSGDNDAGLLNAAPVTTLVRMNGYRFWGNRTCSDDPLFAFESAVRTSQALQDAIARGLIWAIDKPVTRNLIGDVIETINANFRALVAQGRIVGARAWFDPALNAADQLAQGKVTIDYDFTPCAPAENIILNQRITDRYYGQLLGQ
ncbi:MAG: phage tail protein [Alphaproteobacteria bacterium]|nr:MAG: phage tail protein [Alphaproteobacteria bacterium]